MDRDDGCPFLPPPAYSELRESEPITKVRLFDGREAWLFTRYEDIRTVLAHPAASAETLREDFPFLYPGNAVGKRVQNFQRWDDPRHAERRRMFTPYFTLRRIEAMRPAIRARINELYDEMILTGPPLDLVERLALALPSSVACELLGVPYEDHTFFESRFAVWMDRNSSPADVRRINDELDVYLDRVISAKYDTPGDDLLSRFVLDHVATGEVSHVDAITDAKLLLLAGHETTANMIGLGVLALLCHPDQLATLRKDPSLVAGAVEELLRYLSISQSMGVRVAKENFEIDGVSISKGDGLITPVAAGNFDGSIFSDPDTMDVTRQARHHLTFGFGVHQCLGQPLARLELQEIFATIFERFPGLELAIPFEQIAFKSNAVFYGVYELPVTWDADESNEER